MSKEVRANSHTELLVTTIGSAVIAYGSGSPMVGVGVWLCFLAVHFHLDSSTK